MVSLLDAVFVPDDVVETISQDQSKSILRAFAGLVDQRPQIVEYITAKGRVVGPLKDPSEQLTEFDCGVREGQRIMAMDILSMLKIADWSETELREFVALRGASK